MSNNTPMNLVLYRPQVDGTYRRVDITFDTDRNIVSEPESPDDRLNAMGEPYFGKTAVKNESKPFPEPAEPNDVPAVVETVEKPKLENIPPLEEKYEIDENSDGDTGDAARKMMATQQILRHATESEPVEFDIQEPDDLKNAPQGNPVKMRSLELNGTTITQEDLAFSAFYTSSVECFFDGCEDLRKQYQVHELKLREEFKKKGRKCKACDLRNLRNRFNKILRKAFRRELADDEYWYEKLPFKLNTGDADNEA